MGRRGSSPRVPWLLLGGALFVGVLLVASGAAPRGSIPPAAGGAGASGTLAGAKGSAADPTYVILVHGFDPTLLPAYTVWTEGVDDYQQLVDAGYIVGIVSYYGTFTLTFSNGTTLTDPSWFGITSTPIESIGMELGKMIRLAFAHQTVNLDLIGHSMGGLVTEYMLEHVRLPGITIRNVVYLGSPFNGAPLTLLTQYANLSGYEAAEMSEGSPFLTTLHAWVPTARLNNPTTEWLVYAGDANPSWGVAYFNASDDGLVEVPSATDIPHNHAYLFPDLHIPELDLYDPGKVSYFEDQNLANKLLANFAGSY